MAETKSCPKCGVALPLDAPGGLCPACLMRAALESEPNIESAPTLNRTGGSSSFTPPQPAELAQHFPQLELLEFVGAGGMGAVYKARQRGLDRLVALKILPPEIGRDTSFAERFAREARALAQLNHNHIVAVYDFGQVDGLYYIVMEYVDGANLRQTIQSGHLTPRDALAIVPQVCEALQFAHDEGIVHRDIKPENILIDKKGRVKIADFGLAKLLGREGSDHALTGSHQIMGTVRYMAPEQMEGSREVDNRADIYSLGVVFYEMLTGELPLGRFAPPSEKVRLDVRLDEVVLRSLAKEPERRYQQASQVKQDVEHISRSPAQMATVAAPAAIRPATVGTMAEAMATAMPVATKPSVGAATEEPRLSRLAVVGAVWAAIFMLVAPAAMLPTLVLRSGESVSPSWFLVLVLLAVSPVVLTAPFGTTILGAVALAQIQRSNGQLYGRRLAKIDLLFFPLLLMAVLALLAAMLLVRGTLGAGGPDGSRLDSGATILIAVLVAVPTWLIPANILWQLVDKPREPLRFGRWPLIGFGLVIAVLVGSFLMYRLRSSTTSDDARLTIQTIGRNAKVTLNGTPMDVGPDGRLTVILRPGDYETSSLRGNLLLRRVVEFHYPSERKHSTEPEADTIWIRGPLTTAFAPQSTMATLALPSGIQGRWTVISQISDDAFLLESQRNQWLEFDQDTLRSDVPDKSGRTSSDEGPTPPHFAESRFVISSSAEPTKIDFLNTGVRGICRIDGDILTLAVAEPTHSRPTTFRSVASSGVLLTICRRDSSGLRNNRVSPQETIRAERQPELDDDHRLGDAVHWRIRPDGLLEQHGQLLVTRVGVNTIIYPKAFKRPPELTFPTDTRVGQVQFNVQSQSDSEFELFINQSGTETGKPSQLTWRARGEPADANESIVTQWGRIEPKVGEFEVYYPREFARPPFLHFPPVISTSLT